MPLLEVKNLSIRAKSSENKILDDLSFAIEQGGILGLVGESGSGKSTTALAIADLMPDRFIRSSGDILLDGIHLESLSAKKRQAVLAEKVGFIYQDALTALNPLQRIGRQVGELLKRRGMHKTEVKERVLEALTEVGLKDVAQVYQSFPFQLSGGMRQRVLIAMALIAKPCLLIADESTTALDRRLSDQIIDLLKRENEVNGTTILFISHDLSSVSRLSNELLVMKDGVVVERGQTKSVLENPSDPYTKMLLEAIPSPEKKGQALGLNKEPKRSDEKLVVAKKTNEAALLQIRDLCATYGDGDEDHVLEHIDLDIYRGEIVGLLGESGSGKTTIARVLTGQLTPDRGFVTYHGKDISRLSGKARREHTKGLAMIFQDPYSSLDPRLSIEKQIEEPLIIAGIKDKRERLDMVSQMLEQVDLDPILAKRLPANLSGGQRQRVAIAIATIMEPELLIADEAVASLDVSVQAQILNLLLRLRRDIGFSCLFIAHDLDVVYHLSDRVAVLHQGRIVEINTADEIFYRPKHPYTKDLISRWRVT